MPYLKGEEEMIECDVCHEWYHRKCVKLPASAFVPGTNTIEYSCENCVNSGRVVF